MKLTVFSLLTRTPAPSCLGVGGLSGPAATCADPDGGFQENAGNAWRTYGPGRNGNRISISCPSPFRERLRSSLRFRRHVQGDRVHFCRTRGIGFIFLHNRDRWSRCREPVGASSGPKIHLFWVPKVSPAPSRTPRGTPASSRTPQPRKSATLVKKSPIPGDACGHLGNPSPLAPIP